MKLDFIIGGGVASGTSFLSTALVQHPKVYLSKIQRPEPNFFHYSYKFEKGIEWYKETWFKDANDDMLIGERSSLLLTSKVSPTRIKKLFPKVKLIFCLRNPIERSWANYRFTVLEGLEPLSFKEALDLEEERSSKAEGKWAEIQPYAYVKRSLYADCLEDYIGAFGRDNILILKSEDLGKRPEENMKKVCDFLGVENNYNFQFPVNFTSPSVLDQKIQVELRSYFGESFSLLVEAIRKNEDLVKLAKNQKDDEYLKRLKSNLVSRKEPLSENDRKFLAQKFVEELRKLKNILPFSIDDWK